MIRGKTGGGENIEHRTSNIERPTLNIEVKKKDESELFPGPRDLGAGPLPSPFERAARAHLSLGSDWSFAEVVEAHAVSGYVSVTPEVFLLGRAVNSDWSDAELCDPHLWSAEPDCWHVWLLAGDASRVWGLLPYELPWVSFHRRGRLRVVREEVVRRMTV